MQVEPASLDHILALGSTPILGGPEVSQIEAYTTLGYIAARTRRLLARAAHEADILTHQKPERRLLERRLGDLPS